MLRRGLRVTINSDDPAYFGGYVQQNYAETAEALGLRDEEVVQVARNSFLASFLEPAERDAHLRALDEAAAR